HADPQPDTGNNCGASDPAAPVLSHERAIRSELTRAVPAAGILGRDDVISVRRTLKVYRYAQQNIISNKSTDLPARLVVSSHLLHRPCHGNQTPGGIKVHSFNRH